MSESPTFLKTDFGTYELHDALVIARHKEGVDIGADEIQTIVGFLQEHFTGHFSWVGDRCNSFSYHPAVVSQLAPLVSNLRFVAWVTYGMKAKTMPDIKNHIIPKGIQVAYFRTLDEAVEWSRKSLAEL